MSAFFRKPPLGTVKYWRNFLFLKYLRCLLVEEKKSKTLKYKCSKIHRHSCAFLAPCTSDSPFISSSFSSGQRNRAYCASQPQKSVTLQPQPGKERPRSLRGHVVALKKSCAFLFLFLHYLYCYLSKWAGRATRYVLDGPEIKSRCGRDFPHLSWPALGPTQPPIRWIRCLSRV